MPSRHAAARQQFMLPCTCNHASDMYPVCQQRRVTAQETCSPNACPEVSKAVQPIRGCLHRFCRRTDAAPKLLVAKRVCLCLCVSVSVCGEACGVPYGRSVFCLRAGGGGWWVHPRILSLLQYILPSRLPAECILRASLAASHGMCIRYFPYRLRLPGRDIWDSPKMSLASEPAVLATLPALVLEESTPCFHPIPLVAGAARTNLVFDCWRAASSGFTVHG